MIGSQETGEFLPNRESEENNRNKYGYAGKIENHV
jgi:hypothetical protein